MLTIAAMSSVESPFVVIRKGSVSSSCRRHLWNSNLIIPLCCLSSGGAANKARAQKLQEDFESFAVKNSDHLTLLNVFNSFEESGASLSWCDSNSLQFKILKRAKEIRGTSQSLLYCHELLEIDFNLCVYGQRICWEC